MLIVFLILYLCILSVCLCYSVLFYLRHGLAAVVLVGHFLVIISLLERENISLWEREMVGLLIVFFMLYLCVLSVYLCFSVFFYLCHALVHMGLGVGPYGPWDEKSCLWGFRQSKTQTSLLNYRDGLAGYLKICL